MQPDFPVTTPNGASIRGMSHVRPGLRGGRPRPVPGSDQRFLPRMVPHTRSFVQTRPFPSAGPRPSLPGPKKPNEPPLPLDEEDPSRTSESGTSDSEEEDLWDCPLCMEEVDLQDVHFTPCECGYQICRFCWHHIKSVLNDKCPACRRSYTEQELERDLTPAPAKTARGSGKTRSKGSRSKGSSSGTPSVSSTSGSTRGGAPIGNVIPSRRHLVDIRVLQPNLIYVIGIPVTASC